MSVAIRSDLVLWLQRWLQIEDLSELGHLEIAVHSQSVTKIDFDDLDWIEHIASRTSVRPAAGSRGFRDDRACERHPTRASGINRGYALGIIGSR